MGRWPLATVTILGIVLLSAFAPQGAALPTQRLLVSFAGEAPLAGTLLQGGRVLEAFPFAHVALVEGAPDALRLVPGVLGVYPEEVLTPELDRVRAADHADAPVAGDPSWPTGQGVTVAIVDSGVDFTHPGLASRLAADIKISHSGVVTNGDGDADGHGTHVAGILAGTGAGSENQRLRGLAPGAKIVGVDISDSFTTTSAVRAFQWIHDHRVDYAIRVVTSSWGREKTDAHYDENDPVIRASDALVADGLTVVFSAGNRGRDGASTLTTEASNPNVISVGASTLSGRVESYSSRGPALDADGKQLAWVKPDIVAPGSAVLSARTSAKAPAQPTSDEDRYYWEMNGTSMAAPQAAAAAALLLEKHPSLTPLTIQAILQQSARDVGPAGADPDSGYGALDVANALALADAMTQGQRTVTVETRVPVHADGKVVAAGGRVLMLGSDPQRDAPSSVATPVEVPTGGALADLRFSWSGTGAFDAELDAPDGAVFPFDAGPDGSTLVLQHAVHEGVYTLVAKPTGPAGDASYSLDGDIIVRSMRVVSAQMNEFNGHPGTYGSNGGFDVPESAAARVLDSVESSPQAVLSALVFASLLVALVAARPRRR